jgi:hypothetical protein
VRSPATPAAGARLGIAGAAATLAGVILSGPVALGVVHAVRPQPPWHDAARFVAALHPIQIAPYLGGIVLVIGAIAIVVGAHAVAAPELRPRTTLALVLAAVFGALISLNYLVQTTFLPGLVRAEGAASATAISALTMANPRSLGWAIEMWGYGYLGLATWLVAPVFRGERRGSVTAWLFVGNGVASVVGTAATVVSPAWLLGGPGLLAFAAWNVLLAALAVSAWRSFRAIARARA